MRLNLDEHEAAEERRLWADYYEATARVLEIMRSWGTGGNVLPRIAAEHEISHRAMERLKEIRGIR